MMSLNEGPLQKEGQFHRGLLTAAIKFAASMKGPSRRRGNISDAQQIFGGVGLNEGPLQKEGQCVEVEAVWSNSLASMKGPSRRRGNLAPCLLLAAEMPASMKGPSRRRGNRWGLLVVS